MRGHTKKPSPFSLSLDKKATRKLWASPPKKSLILHSFFFFSFRLEDEWLPLGAVPRTRSVKISHLPEAAKVKLHDDLFCKEEETPNNSPSAGGPPRGASRRKQKWPPRPMKRTEDGAAAII